MYYKYNNIFQLFYVLYLSQKKYFKERHVIDNFVKKIMKLMKLFQVHQKICSVSL